MYVIPYCIVRGAMRDQPWHSVPYYVLSSFIVHPLDVILCSSIRLPPLRSDPAQCMLFYGPAISSWHVSTETMYVILCSCSSLRGLYPGAVYVILCSWVSLPFTIHLTTSYAILWSCSSTMPLQHWIYVCYSDCTPYLYPASKMWGL